MSFPKEDGICIGLEELNSTEKNVMQFPYYECAGYLIPKDWCVVASLTSVHMDDMIYENPFEFDPWRWEVSNQTTKPICRH